MESMLIYQISNSQLTNASFGDLKTCLVASNQRMTYEKSKPFSSKRVTYAKVKTIKK